MQDIGWVSILIGAAIAWALFPIVWPVQGVWKREGEEEYLELHQFGPVVSGKRNVDGGNQMYSGFQHFFWLSLKRRDYGIPALIAQGFPEAIAKKINGSVTGRMRLTRRRAARLSGAFRAQKILFDEASAQVLSRRYQAALPRAFAKTALTELPGSKAARERTNLPPPPKQSKRRTF